MIHSLYIITACELAWPQVTPKERIGTLHPNTLEIFRDLFAFYLRNNMVDDAIAQAERLVVLFQAFQTESSMCKIMFAISVLLLSKGDVVKAEQVYLQEHLNNSQYISSKECALAEDFIMSFKHLDMEKLAAAQASTTLIYVDRDVQDYARRLSLLTSKTQVERNLDKLSHEMNSLTVGGIGVATRSAAASNDTSEDDPFDAQGNLKENSISTAAAVGKSSYHSTGDDEIDLT
jgi:hypothetical protein